MNILCVTPESDYHKTPEMGFTELLVNSGHKVARVTTGYNLDLIEINRYVVEMLSINKPDVVWGMMEYSLPTAAIYAKLLDVPLVAHIECIPPWRVGLNTLEEYGFDYKGNFNEANIEHFTKLYKLILKYYDEADLRTISGNEWRYTYEKFTGSPLDAKTRYYTWNDDDLKKYKGSYEEKNQICTIARFTPIKRVHHIIRAIAKIPKFIRPAYKLVGYGSEKNYLLKLAKDLDVNMEMVGSGMDGLKERVIQESMFMVQIFAGIPVIEGAYYEKVAVSYDMAHMHEVYCDMPVWVETNNIVKLSKQIEELILDKEKRVELGKNAKKLLIEGKTNVNTNEKFVETVIKQFKQAITRHKLKTNYLFMKPLIKQVTDEKQLDYAHYRIINDVDFKGNVLDAGSGCCVFSIIAKQTKPWINMVSLERNPIYANLGFALAINSNTNINITNNKIDDKIFNTNQFDTVVLSHVFEHCSNLDDVMKWIIRITKPGGTIFMSFPYGNHHDSQEHYHYFSNKTGIIINSLNGTKTCVNINDFLNNYNVSKEVEVINEIEKDEHKKDKCGGYLSFFIKLKNNKK